jgi:hypothetical protein
MAGRVWAPRVSEPSASFAADYRRSLAARRFGRGIPKRVWQLDHLSRWLEREGVSVEQVTPERAEQFVAARRVAGYATWVSPVSVRLPLAFLREAGVLPVPVAVVADGPAERLVADYR